MSNPSIDHDVHMTVGATASTRPVGDADVEAVRAILGEIMDPCSIATGVPISLLDMGIVRFVRAAGQHVHVCFQLTSPVCMQVNLIAQKLDERCRESGIRVEAEFDPFTEWMPDMMADSARAALRRLRPLPLSVTEQSRSS